MHINLFSLKYLSLSVLSKSENECNLLLLYRKVTVCQRDLYFLWYNSTAHRLGYKYSAQSPITDCATLHLS